MKQQGLGLVERGETMFALIAATIAIDDGRRSRFEPAHGLLSDQTGRLPLRADGIFLSERQLEERAS